MFVWKDKEKPGFVLPVQAQMGASRPLSRPPASPVPRHHLAAIVAENTATQSSQKEEEEGGEPTGSQMIHEVLTEPNESAASKREVIRSDQTVAVLALKLGRRRWETTPTNSPVPRLCCPPLDKTNRQFCQTNASSLFLQL